MLFWLLDKLAPRERPVVRDRLNQARSLLASSLPPNSGDQVILETCAGHIASTNYTEALDRISSVAWEHEDRGRSIPLQFWALLRETAGRLYSRRFFEFDFRAPKDYFAPLISKYSGQKDKGAKRVAELLHKEGWAEFWLVTVLRELYKLNLESAKDIAHGVRWIKMPAGTCLATFASDIHIVNRVIFRCLDAPNAVLEAHLKFGPDLFSAVFLSSGQEVETWSYSKDGIFQGTAAASMAPAFSHTWKAAMQDLPGFKKQVSRQWPEVLRQSTYDATSGVLTGRFEIRLYDDDCRPDASKPVRSFIVRVRETQDEMHVSFAKDNDKL